ncbi:NAD(P)H-binding protein [Citricoccus sp. NPDC079358]|uniref:NAD(P)-dependent oxidoreductase n=1 Tax=Citricoccus sp. NPDC079358 TaxID=3154653 RepID=UPI00344BCCB7
MKILVIGGTGNAGHRIAQEALGRGHSVTLASRGGGSSPHAGSEGLTSLILDSADAEAVTVAAHGHELIVGATRLAVGREADIVASTRGLAVGARNARVRLLVIGGAGPLLVPGTDRLAIDDPRWVPSEIRPIATASNQQLEILRKHPDADWTYLAPAAHFAPGHRTGRYTTADSELVIASDGSSMISIEDYAIALMDLAEAPDERHRVIAVGPSD